MTPIHAIGDIHGHLAQLDAALDAIARHGEPTAQVVFLGDFVDRGPDARRVIETLMQGQADGRPWICLLGNHDRFIARYLANPKYCDPNTSRPLLWTDTPLGGRATLASYGVDASEDRRIEDIHADAVAAIPQAHLDWIAGLPRYYETDDHIFVHAGLRPGVPLRAQKEDDLIWIRDGFLNSDHRWDRLVVHGHTALDHPQLYHNRLNLDGGAGYGRPLVPALLEGRAVSVLNQTGRSPLAVSAVTSS
ncbi:metallophosphoesterase family protein [Pseudoruegeria sp. SK021]|uniref:metallophosphoesterase family protein n=1 Tax=Pseudoruegeria sp. SK021 TaxID=1933035 RepID=UPI000A23F9FC|nr:metallophosphoesterase family protein [Pseudoruegeria sp. SK021]OSP54807.1 serine/threonine protein phosphatase [Pseudoruegeria sp. SK021]